MPQLTSAAGEGYKGFSLDLGNNRLASVKMYKGKTQVDLREHYEKDGDLDPGERILLLPPCVEGGGGVDKGIAVDLGNNWMASFKI